MVALVDTAEYAIIIAKQLVAKLDATDKGNRLTTIIQFLQQELDGPYADHIRDSLRSVREMEQIVSDCKRMRYLIEHIHSGAGMYLDTPVAGERCLYLFHGEYECFAPRMPGSDFCERDHS